MAVIPSPETGDIQVGPLAVHVAGLIGGRLYFIATSWSEVPSHWWGPLAVWKGGLSIWGGIVLGTVVGVWRLRRARADAYAFMDVAAPGLLIAQAIGRIGSAS